MAFNVNQLGKLDRAVAIGGGLAFIAGFLPWWGYRGPHSIYVPSVSGWNAGFAAVAGMLLMAAAAAYLVLRRAEVKLPELPVGPAVAVAGASLIGLGLVVLKWLTLPRIGPRLGGSIGPRFGIWLAMIGGVVELVGAVGLFRGSGESLPWEQAPPPSPPPPPRAE
ncbi:MAG TPA: hypothetical protein VFJ85_03310 [Acidimicrobiales bacterium]|nr:hypothetical protein [Acidimicrobiales bacterium]